MDDDVDFGAEPGQSFIDRVVDDFVNEVMQSIDAGRTDIHRRPLPDCLQALENFDMLSTVIRFCSRYLSLVVAPGNAYLLCHVFATYTSKGGCHAAASFSVECSERKNARSGQKSNNYFNKDRPIFRQETLEQTETEISVI
jgi:hypothetical protein